MSWITAILQLYSQVTDLLGNVIVKRINMRVFDLLARFHYILNLPRILVACTFTNLRMIFVSVFWTLSNVLEDFYYVNNASIST